jgi:hypothetical protein
MDELAQAVAAVRGVRSAFQTLYGFLALALLGAAVALWQHNSPLCSRNIDAPSLSNPLTAVKDDILAQVANAVQGARSAFQIFCSDYKVFHGPDSHDLFALDVSLQALGNSVELLDRISPGDEHFELVHSILASPVVLSASEHQDSMADAMITDMHTLKCRLMDAASIQSFLPGEVRRIRQMVKKYHSIITEALNAQILYVIES